MLVKALRYGYCIQEGFQLEDCPAFPEEITFRVMATNNRTDFRTISNFRTENLGELSSLFVQALELCSKADLAKLGHVALDGTRVKGNVPGPRR